MDYFLWYNCGMAKDVLTIKSLDDLTPDPANANRHSQRGMSMMENSIRECGYGDSLTVDRNGVVISGNARTEVLADVKMLDPIVVQSDGTRPVIHQRTDLDFASDPRAKKLALFQNRVGQVNLEWDTEVLAELSQELDLKDLWNNDELTELLGTGFEPVGEDEQGRLDQKSEIECPECGHKFAPS